LLKKNSNYDRLVFSSAATTTIGAGKERNRLVVFINRKIGGA